MGKIDPVKKIAPTPVRRKGMGAIFFTTPAAAKAKHPLTTVCMGIYRESAMGMP